MLSFELCQQIRKILTDESEYPYINDTLAVELKAKREERGKSLRGSALPVESFPGGAHIWTFAGGRINHTIRSIFGLVGGLKVISDNFQLRLEGGNATLKAIYKIFDRMREPEFWTDRSVWGPITAGLPEYRLSKFQRALPPAFSEEMLMGYLLDVEGTRRLVNSGRDAVGVLL